MKKLGFRIAVMMISFICLFNTLTFSLSAAVGCDYNFDTYTLGGSNGYFESNYAYNANINCIMYAETRVVNYPTYTGSLSMLLYTQTSGAGNPLASDYITTGDVSSPLITNRITYTDLTLLVSGSYGDIHHKVYNSYGTVIQQCKYRGVWYSSALGWDFAVKLI